jgi:S1-C subfamily serine protease
VYVSPNGKVISTISNGRKCEGCQPTKRQLEIVRQLDSSVYAKLTAKHWLTVKSNHTNANVYIDNKYKGKTELKVQLAPDYYSISVSKTGYNKFLQQIELDEDMVLWASLSKTKESNENSSPKTDEIVSASSGSGFAVSSNGHVITNHHVIEGCQKVKIHHNGRSIPATVVTFDPQNDLALLKGNFRPSTVLPLSTNSPELLQDVYVAGYPFGRRISTGVKVTKGIISSLTGIGNNFSNIQIDAALQPGNSGGPILDDRGNVVGVAVAKLDIKKILKNFGVIPEDTNFGIKASVVRSILESSNVSSPRPNTSSISKTKLGKMISDGTYYLSCWMTTAQIEKMRSKKVIFQSLE